MNGNKTEIISTTITITPQHSHKVIITIIKQCGEIPISFALTVLLFNIGTVGCQW